MHVVPTKIIYVICITYDAENCVRFCKAIMQFHVKFSYDFSSVNGILNNLDNCTNARKPF